MNLLQAAPCERILIKEINLLSSSCFFNRKTPSAKMVSRFRLIICLSLLLTTCELVSGIRDIKQGLGSLHKSSLTKPIIIRGGGGATRKRKIVKKRVPRIDASKQSLGENGVIERKDNDAAVLSISSQRIERDMPTIKAVLIPRQISIPQIIRLVSAFLFTFSLLESLRTSGTPYNEAVISTLKAHGIKLLLGRGTAGENEHGGPKITSLDEFLARKISQSENNMLPPKHFPSSLPLLGLAAASVMNVGLTTLFPKWFVEWNAWLNFHRIDTGSDKQPNELQIIESHLREDERNGSNEAEDLFYKSQFINRSYTSVGKGSNYKCTGLYLLVQMSKQEREMSKDSKNAEDIQSLYRSESKDHPAPYFIEIGQRRIYVQLELEHGKLSASCIDGGPSFFAQEEIPALIQRGSIGLSCLEDLQYAESVYGSYNDLTLPTPTVHDAFIARLSSPLAVLQLMGRILSALEENFIPALLNVLMTLGQHYMNAKKSIVSAKELSNEIKGNVNDSGDLVFWTLRPKNVENGKKKKKGSKEWIPLSAQKILPGDVFFLPSHDFMMPVDALVLEGNCISQEAVITGESVPQAKSAVESDSTSGDTSEMLSMESKHRNAVLFAGTTIMSSTNERDESVDTNLPKKLLSASSPVKCLALKTGSYSSKGEIIRALAKSSGQAGGISTEQSDKDSIRLIGALSICALVACTSLFVSNADYVIKKTSGFRRVIQCSRICVASIPSDLPMALNSVVHSCAATLRREADVVCSDLGALLTASQIDMVVFDKTGTLTSDTQAMTNITSLPEDGLHPMANIVLAGCHSLSSIHSKTIGDPLDISGLEYSQWVFNSTNKTAVPKQSVRRQSAKMIWQIKSFPFDASRRRSSALLLVQNKDGSTQLWKAVKGSSEGMRHLLRSNVLGDKNEADYLCSFDEATDSLGCKGIRSVAMAVQDISASMLAKVLFPLGLPKTKVEESEKDLKRFQKAVSNARRIAKADVHIDSFEQAKSLEFAGFACFDASIRPSTPRIVGHIRQSGTKVCMLTGDGSAAALAVAKQSNFFDKRQCKRVAILDVNEFSQLQWKVNMYKSGKHFKTREFSIDATSDFLAKQRTGSYALLLTGNAVELLLELAHANTTSAISMLENLDKVAVIARSSPQTKQQILSILKSNCGNKVMMCGDGVNDIGALKTADISAALLNGFGVEKLSSSDGIDAENERRKTKLKQRKIGRKIGGAEFGVDGKSRIKNKLDEALQDSQDPQIGMDALTKLVKEEFKRATALQKGGAKAARILQQEENLRKSVRDKSLLDGSGDVDEDIDSIKPGEASLAAAFTFLRPCIDGADSIIRNGIAAAAFALSSHR